MSYTNLTSDQMFAITNLKEMYESNNRVLTNVTQITNSNFNNDIITNLVNNLISTNNQIKNNIISMLNVNNTNTNTNTNNRQPNNRQQNYSNRPNYHRNRQQYLNNPTISNLFYTFFDPIEIFPTPSQIESATRVVRFGDIIRPLNPACPITLENFNDDDQVLIIRHCNHIFNNAALNSWFRSNCRCPVCRYDIRNYVSTNTNNISSNVDLSSNNISDIANNVDLSSNYLSTPLNSVERSNQSLISTNQFVDLLFSSLLNNRNITDLSGNSLSGNSLSSNNRESDTHSTDNSGNSVLRFFYTSEQ